MWLPRFASARHVTSSNCRGLSLQTGPSVVSEMPDLRQRAVAQAVPFAQAERNQRKRCDSQEKFEFKLRSPSRRLLNDKQKSCANVILVFLLV